MSDILIAILFLATLVFIYFREQDIAAERQKLYDRIQAADLKEYKLLADPPPKPEKKEKERHDFI